MLSRTNCEMVIVNALEPSCRMVCRRDTVPMASMYVAGKRGTVLWYIGALTSPGKICMKVASMMDGHEPDCRKTLPMRNTMALVGTMSLFIGSGAQMSAKATGLLVAEMVEL